MSNKITYSQLRKGYEEAIRNSQLPHEFIVVSIGTLRAVFGDKVVEEEIRKGRAFRVPITKVVEDEYETQIWPN